MKDKICGMFFIFISTALYLTHFAFSAYWASQLKSWNSNYGKMGTAMKELGYVPLFLALLALGLGIFYFVRAERRGQANSNDKS